MNWPKPFTGLDKRVPPVVVLTPDPACFSSPRLTGSHCSPKTSGVGRAISPETVPGNRKQGRPPGKNRRRQRGERALWPRALPGPGRPPAGPNAFLRPCGVAPSRTRPHGFHTARTPDWSKVTLTRTGANAPAHFSAFFRHLKPPPGITLPADHQPTGPGGDRHAPAGAESALGEQGKNDGTHALGASGQA